MYLNNGQVGMSDLFETAADIVGTATYGVDAANAIKDLWAEPQGAVEYVPSSGSDRPILPQIDYDANVGITNQKKEGPNWLLIGGAVAAGGIILYLVTKKKKR